MVTNYRNYKLFPVYLLGFLFAFNVALPTFVNSSFLGVFIPERLVGLIYILASVLIIVCFFSLPFILKRFGNYNVAIALVILEMLGIAGLLFTSTLLWIVPAFILVLIPVSLIYLTIDIFLEGYSRNQETGQIRGITLSFDNLAWVFAPLIVGLILVNNEYWKVYAVAFLFLIPVALILLTSLKKFKDSDYQAPNILSTLKKVSQHKNLSNIFWSSFLLQFFYSWMTIYTPIYLNRSMGFSWGQIGVVFSIMLLPFIFVQFPLGRLADKKYGEKEILSIGFIVMAIATGVIFFMTTKNIFLWGGLLFITRIGAAAVEVMNDTYFFKKVGSLDANIISLFRMSRPIAYILGPLVATVILSFFTADLKYLFIVLGLLMFFGLRFSLALKDTK